MRQFTKHPIFPRNCLAVCLLATLVGSRGVDLRTPSLQAAAAAESELLLGGSANDLYAPSLQGLVGGNCDSAYAADGDTMRLLYDMDFDQPEEPPRELSKVSLPTYRIEPPDIIAIEALKLARQGGVL